MSRVRALVRRPWSVAALALLVAIALNAAFTPHFVDVRWQDGRLFGALIDVLHRAAPVALLALGLTAVIGTGGIDLSVGSVMALAAAVAATLAESHGAGTATIVLAALAIGVVAGLWNGMLVSVLRVQPVVATLILLVAGRGLAQLVTSGRKVPIADATLDRLVNGSLAGLPATLWLVIGAAVVLALALRRTSFGLSVEAIGDNPRAAALAGLPVTTILLLAYAMCGAFAASAGLVALADIRQADVFATGVNLELDGILAVVIGGTALTGGRMTLLGSLFGALLMQTVSTALLLHGLGPEDALILKALVVVLVFALRARRAR